MDGRILLVEDNEHVVSALTILLESGGHVVHSARSVAEATARGREDTPHLLLLDLTLPDGDGLEVLRALRAIDRAPTLTVALTGHEDPVTVARCEAAGCHAVLVKPVPVRELLTRVAGWMDEARERQPPAAS